MSKMAKFGPERRVLSRSIRDFAIGALSLLAVGLAPMHTWKPDVYGEAPPPIGALLAGVLTSCAFLAFFRIAQICMHAHIGDIFSPVFILLGILSIAIAAIFIMGQKDFSRLLGYSSIEHMGIIVLGLGLGGQAVWASFYHVINNSFVKGLIFLAAGNVYRIYKTKKVADIQGSIHSLPVSSVFLLVGFILKEPYRLNRLRVFFNPEHDPAGSGYQVSQSFIALGSGGFFGQGLGNGRQKLLYLPAYPTLSSRLARILYFAWLDI